MAKAPAHASTGELLQLAVDRDGWCREVLRIDPPLVCHSTRLGKKQIASVETQLSTSSEKRLEGATKIDSHKYNGL